MVKGPHNMRNSWSRVAALGRLRTAAVTPSLTPALGLGEAAPVAMTETATEQSTQRGLLGNRPHAHLSF